MLHHLGDWRGNMDLHRRITQALEVRDAERAEALLQQHIGGFQQRIKATL